MSPSTSLRGVFGEVDLPRLGDLLHPGREVGRVPERRIIHPEIVPDLPNHHLARIKAHPY